MPYSALPYPSNLPLQQLKVIAADTTIYIAPDVNGKTGTTSTWTGLTYGDDSGGDGTLAKPFATLKRAWTEAQKYNITGNAVLTIQFQKGIYNYAYTATDTNTNPFPTNLYHPQGQNIIIQGDLDGIKQRYIYRVKDYSWDMSRWAYFGHTGTVNTWYAVHRGGDTAANYPAGTGTTAHGFSWQDEGQYVAVSNVYMGTPLGTYRDYYNGVNSAKYTYNYPNNWGRYVFNHGLSYEEAYAIVGLARIEGASSSNEDLRLQFKYQNLDGRVHTYPQPGLNSTGNGRIDGGLGNGLSYAGVNSNYPEPQYSNPNGYYGPTFGVSTTGTLVPNTAGTLWGNVSMMGNGEAGINVGYPSRAVGETHITDDAHLLTNYPVVIRTTSTGVANATSKQPIPLVLSGCQIRSIRNLMFVNGNIEGATWGARAPINGMDGMQSMQLGSQNGVNYPYASPVLLLDCGAKTSIRHLGSVGYGKAGNLGAITVYDSTLTADRFYNASEATLTVGAGNIHSTGNPEVSAELGNLSNTPVWFSTHGGGLFVSGKGSFVNFDIMDRIKASGTFRTDATTWIQNADYFPFISHDGARVTLGTTHLINNWHLPGFVRIRLDLPVFPGASLPTGITGAFFNPEILNNSRGDYYKSIVGYKNTGGSRVPVLRVFAVQGDTQYNTTSGWYNATWQGGTSTLSATSVRPAYTQTMYLYGIRLNQTGFDSDSAIRTWTSTAGNTLEFIAYKADGVEGTPIPNEYLGLSNTGIRIGTTGGYTLSGAIANANDYGITTGAVYLYNYQSGSPCPIYARSGSDVQVNGSILGSGRSYVGAWIDDGSRFVVRDAILMRDHTHSGILSQGSSKFVSSHAYIKHPGSYGIGNGTEDAFGYNFGIYSRFGGAISIGYSTTLASYGVGVAIGPPFSANASVNEAGQARGIYGLSTLTPATDLSGLTAKNNPLAVSSGGIFRVPYAASPVFFGFDGGTAAEASSTSPTVATLNDACTLTGLANIHHVWNALQGQVAGSGIRIMTRADYGKVPGNQLMYNAPIGATMWWTVTIGPTSGTAYNCGTDSPSASVNTLYRASVQYAANPTISASYFGPLKVSTPQWNAPYTAYGYSGPAIGDVANTNYLSNTAIFGL